MLIENCTQKGECVYDEKVSNLSIIVNANSKLLFIRIIVT